MSSIDAEVLAPGALPVPVLEAWRELQRATPAFGSPLLGPEFAAAVGSVRPDAAVAVFRRRGAVVGLLAHHRRPGGVARPVGSVWSDYHALLTAPGEPLDPAGALSAAGLSAYHFKSLIDPYGLFAASVAEQGEGHLIALRDADGDAYWETLRAASAKRFKNMRRLEHKLERDIGQITLDAPDPDPAAFEQLLAWKKAQFARTGAHDVLRSAWSDGLMRALFDRRDGPMQGLMLTLRVAGRPVASHFGIRQGDAFHPWLAAFDPELSAYSPGQVFMGHAIPAMTRLGLASYDLSQGYEHYKRPFASDQVPVSAGVARAVGGPARLSLDRTLEVAGAAFGARGSQAIARVRSRLDHIATAELSLGGRLHGLAVAVAASQLRKPERAPAPASES